MVKIDHFLGASWDRFLVVFRFENGAKLAFKWDHKSLLIPKGEFSKKPWFSFRGFFFWDPGVQVGSKNRWKIDVKNDAETERLGNSILIDFWSIWEPSWSSKREPRRSKVDVEMASKFDQFLEASWNTFFSTKKRSGSRHSPASPRKMESARVTGGGFRRGKAGRSDSKNL